MRILGIDPGLATTGLGLIEFLKPNRFKALDWLVITTKPGLETVERLREITDDLRTFIRQEKPELVAIEKVFFATNKKTAIDVSQARGAILLTVHQQGIPILEATPLQLKMAVTGHGQADKKQMQDMVKLALKLSERPEPDDAADALALALYGAYNAHLLEMRSTKNQSLRSKQNINSKIKKP